MTMISIICYAFNPRQDHFFAFIESVLSQTVSHWELIMIDDGSDPPLCVGGDPRIRLIRHAENYGMLNVHFSWGEGWRASRGELVTACGSDDVMAPHRFERILSVFRDCPDLDLLHHDALFIDAEGGIVPAGVEEIPERLRRWWIFHRKEVIRRPWGCLHFVDSGDRDGLYDRLVGGENLLAHPTVVMRRDLLERVGSPEWGPVADYQYWIRCAEDRRIQIRYLDEMLMAYRVHNGSGCVSQGERVWEQTQMMLTYWRERRS